jgi:hypothetical protein
MLFPPDQLFFSKIAHRSETFIVIFGATAVCFIGLVNGISPAANSLFSEDSGRLAAYFRASKNPYLAQGTG